MLVDVKIKDPVLCLGSTKDKNGEKKESRDDAEGDM